MAKPADIEGLNRHEWRIADPEGVSVAQRKEKETLVHGWHNSTSADLRAKLEEFERTHYDCVVSLDHDFDDHPYGSGCEYRLEVEGWRTVTDGELEREHGRQRALLHTRELELERQLAAQREHAERELAQIRERRKQL